MARIFDNIEQEPRGALRATLAVLNRADFCVGYLNLRGWQAVDDVVSWAAGRTAALVTPCRSSADFCDAGNFGTLARQQADKIVHRCGRGCGPQQRPAIGAQLKFDLLAGLDAQLLQHLTSEGDLA